jgi:hypothetical protein
MIIDLIEVLNKEEDPDPEEIISDPDLRCPKCNGSFGSGTLILGGRIQDPVSLGRPDPDLV